jgi:hypothetical protein
MLKAKMAFSWLGDWAVAVSENSGGWTLLAAAADFDVDEVVWR